ncbi:MAG: hypothetical protein EHM83_12965, partial [Burkholderiales bacterium]
GQERAGEDGGEAQPVDFSDQKPVGRCPKCGAGVFEHGMSYVCEKSVGPARSCDFRSGKIILQQEIAREQMTKLLAEGRTDLLQGFVSSRTRRRFKAFLVRGADGKIGFEFEPRPARTAAKAGAAKAGAETAATAGADKPASSASGAAAKKARVKAPARKAPARKAATRKAPARKTATRNAATRNAAIKTATKAPTSAAGKAPAKAAARRAPRAAKSAKT